MDSSMISTLIGAGLAIVASIGTTWFSRWLTQKQEKETKYYAKMEEIQELAIQIKLWADFAFEQWWLDYEYNADHERNTLPCPIDRLELLTAIYEPALLDNISEIKKLINNIEHIGVEMHEEGRSLQNFYPEIRQRSKHFTEAYERFHLILMQINKKYNKKGAVKLSVPLQVTEATRPNIQDQTPDF